MYQLRRDTCWQFHVQIQLIFKPTWMTKKIVFELILRLAFQENSIQPKPKFNFKALYPCSPMHNAYSQNSIGLYWLIYAVKCKAHAQVFECWRLTLKTALAWADVLEFSITIRHLSQMHLFSCILVRFGSTPTFHLQSIDCQRSLLKEKRHFLCFENGTIGDNQRGINMALNLSTSWKANQIEKNCPQNNRSARFYWTNMRICHTYRVHLYYWTG